MATETATATNVSIEHGDWRAGVAGGLAGGLVFGAMMSVMTPGVLEMAIPAMYGIEGPPAPSAGRSTCPTARSSVSDSPRSRV